MTYSNDGWYLDHKSDLGLFHLTSDAFIHTYSSWKRTQDLIKQIPKNEIEYFQYISYTIGGCILFPGNRINGLSTMNQERGTNKYINDRMDLTLECIKRYYNNEKSPLFETIERYNDFFQLFESFKGYCEYFLLQDLTLENCSKINFFLPFEDFIFNILPKTTDEYYIYKRNSIEFLEKRNKRIVEYNKNN